MIRDGETIFRRAFGAADPESGTMISPETTVFSIASVTKQFTAFAAFLLVQDGRLDLDAEVRRYLAWLPDFGPPITVRHLIHHTSGLREYSMLATLQGEQYLDEEPFRQQDGIALMAAQRELNFPPGTDLIYTNTNFMFLAEVVAAVSGQSFQSFMAESVFQPLGMASTSVQGPDATVTGYIGEADFKGMTTWGESGVLTTADDLAIWARHLLSPSYQPEATRRLFERGRLSDGTELAYAGGLLYGSTGGVETVGHGGSLPLLGFVADLILVPSRQLAVVILGNTREAVDRGADVLAALLPEAAESEPDAAEVPSDRYDTWVGRYVSIYDAFELVVEGGELIYRAGTREHLIKPTVDGRFQLPRSKAPAIARKGKERIQAIEVERELSTLVYHRVTPTDPQSMDLSAYAGTYRSEELAMALTFEAMEGFLMATGKGPLSTRFDPVTGDIFRSTYRNLLFRFRRDGAGSVTEMQVDMSRIRGLRFVRTEPLSHSVE